jgi:hypothetical protein
MAHSTEAHPDLKLIMTDERRKNPRPGSRGDAASTSEAESAEVGSRACVVIELYRRLPSDGSPPDTARTLPFGLRRRRRRLRSDAESRRQSLQILSFGNNGFTRPHAAHRLRRNALSLYINIINATQHAFGVSLNANPQSGNPVDKANAIGVRHGDLRGLPIPRISAPWKFSASA